MKLGVLGGTFDPVHLGHLILADEAIYQLGLNRVLWVLTPNPPHKQGIHISSGEQRLRLLEIALGDNTAWEISHVDLKRNPPYYALDTMRSLRLQFPAAQLFYLMGGDSLNDLPRWHRPKEFVDICDGFGVMHRPGVHLDLTNLDKQIPGIREKIYIVDAPLLDISSSNIRERISTGKPFRYYLPPEEYQYILKHQLYLT